MRAEVIAIIVVVAGAIVVDMAGAAATAHDQDAEPELLEFLGIWQTPVGRLINPFDLLDDLDDSPPSTLNQIPAPPDQRQHTTPGHQFTDQPTTKLPKTEPLPERQTQ